MPKKRKKKESNTNPSPGIRTTIIMDDAVVENAEVEQMPNAAEDDGDEDMAPLAEQPAPAEILDRSPEMPDLRNDIEHRPPEEKDDEEMFCDGPGARTRSKMGQEATTNNSNFGKLSSPSFLVQIPFYALKKEKNRKCSVCGKHGRTPSDLLRHMRVHTGERPFPCVGCDKKFKCKRSQLTHQYLTHSITDGLSSHRLQILSLKKLRRSPKNSFPSVSYDLPPPALENQVLASEQEPKYEIPKGIDQDEDTEIVAADGVSPTSEVKTTFEGFFPSQQNEDVSSKIPDLNDDYLDTASDKEQMNEQGPFPEEEEFDEEEDVEEEEKAPDLTLEEDMNADQQTESLKVPILRIKTHKCTHCKRQFRSIYTLRYHLRSMHDEKVYLSPALESRLKKRRWLPPHVRLQKPKINFSLGLLLKNKTLNENEAPTDQQENPEPCNGEQRSADCMRVESENPETTVDDEIKRNIPSPVLLPVPSPLPPPPPPPPTATTTKAVTFPIENHVEFHKPEQKQEQEHHVPTFQQKENYPSSNTTFDTTSIKTEKQDSFSIEASSFISTPSTDLNNNSSSTLRNILTSKESLFNQLHQYSTSLSSQLSEVVNTVHPSKSPSNSSFMVPPHIFLPSNSQLDERLENNKPVSWESLRVTSENVLVTKMEAVHPTTQQKYVLYKCSQCGKAFSGLRAIGIHLASHNDNAGRDCEKCGASFKWQRELDSHMECHRADRKYMTNSQQFLPSYYVNPFPIPVLPTSEQTMMPTTGLLSYPFFPMPQQISPLVQPGFFPFFAAALQPSSQVPLGDNVSQQQQQQPPSVVSQALTNGILTQETPKDSLEDKNLPQNCSFQCKMCPKTFDRIFSLQRHERIHSGVKACFCKTCGRGFSELRNLRHHIVRFHADTAKMEPLPYRRQPTRVKSSSQRLVSFLKKTAVRILNSMGQSKLDPPASSVKIQTETDDFVNDTGIIRHRHQHGTEEQDAHSEDLPQNLSMNSKFSNDVHKDDCNQGPIDQNNTAKTPDLQTPLLANSLSESNHSMNYLKVPELEDLPTVNGSSSILNDAAKCITPSKSNNSNSNSRPMEVMHDPKRSLLGNRRKGRPFKLSTNNNTCNFLNPMADENLFAITQKILNGMPKLNIEHSATFLGAPPVVGGSIPPMPFFNPELSSNEPLDMSNGVKKPEEIKTEINQSTEPAISESTPNFSSISQITEALSSNAKLLTTPDKCLIPCTYCHRTFNSLSDLNRHMTFHADIRPFKCPYCSYCSRTNSQLKVHMMRHEGIKHYMCQICNYNGVTQSDLNRHLKTRTHLLRSRNICACCGTGFHTRSLSEEHYKSCRVMGGQDPAKNTKDTSGRLVMENKNRGNRLKHVQKPNNDPAIKKEFFKNLFELGKMGVPFADFLQQGNATNVIK